ncbi:MAG: hypothetical protein ACK5SX_04095 [Sandaracinobacter sp.]
MYLVVVLTGVFALAFVPASLSLGRDTAENVRLIALDIGFYRLGLLGLLVNQLVFLLLPLLLWRLLHAHGEAASVAMMALLAVAGVSPVLSAFVWMQRGTGYFLG